jgi:hypothetical protein
MMKNWIRKQFRKKPRVYIFPTRMGGYLNGLIFLMFLLSIGYSNNLLLIFTIFLFSFNLLWLIQTHFHLHRLRPDQVSIFTGHAGAAINVSIFWKAIPKGPWNWQIQLESDHGDFSFSRIKDDKAKCVGEITPDKRGQYQWSYLKVKTSNPFGLYQVWIYFPLNLSTLVYPSLLQSVDLTLRGKDFEGEIMQDKIGNDDFRGLGNYMNDESRKISWKHYARSGDLFIKEGEEKKTPVLELELTVPAESTHKEQYLSYLATQMVECHRRDIPFLLKVNGAQSGQLADCLKVLTLC